MFNETIQDSRSHLREDVCDMIHSCNDEVSVILHGEVLVIKVLSYISDLLLKERDHIFLEPWINKISC